MNVRKFAIGIGIGIVAGFLISERLTRKNIPPEKALELVKDKLAKKHNITGSWIHIIPEALNKNNIDYKVYRGGITTIIDGNKTLQYDFSVDSTTGELIELTS